MTCRRIKILLNLVTPSDLSSRGTACPPWRKGSCGLAVIRVSKILLFTTNCSFHLTPSSRTSAGQALSIWRGEKCAKLGEGEYPKTLSNCSEHLISNKCTIEFTSDTFSVFPRNEGFIKLQ